MKAFVMTVFAAALCATLTLPVASCGRDNRNSRDSSTPAGQEPGSGLGSGGNQTGANTGVQGKTATGAGAGAVGGVRGKAGDTGTNEDARDSQNTQGSSEARQRP